MQLKHETIDQSSQVSTTPQVPYRTDGTIFVSNSSMPTTRNRQDDHDRAKH